MKRDLWRTYRQLKCDRPTREGYTMSETPNAAVAAAALNTRKHYEKQLERLQQLTKAYGELKAKARDRWQYAEANAIDSRRFDREAAAVLRECVELLKQLAGVETVNALRALASLDARPGELFQVRGDLSSAVEAGELWDDRDTAGLPEWDEHKEDDATADSAQDLDSPGKEEGASHAE